MSIPPAESSVFTTLRWNNSGDVAWLSQHLSRLRVHAERLGIEWPKDMSQSLQDVSIGGVGNLCRIQLSRDGTVALTLRECKYPNSPLIAVSYSAPRFSEKVQGTKHAAWDEYREARSYSIENGANISLLVHEGTVVDGDQCTPVLLDVDGVALAPTPEGGGVESVTLSILKPIIEAAGIPFRYARITENLLGRARELIVVGTGVGVAWVNEIDGQSIGIGSPGPLFEACNSGFQSELEGAWAPLR